ncbi:MAG: flagellar biosynthetic protein FliP [Rhodospirillaceae bacterium]|nr:flagellar biosynthetic protein FliP [Rhodospirillaceae bacterium]
MKAWRRPLLILALLAPFLFLGVRWAAAQSLSLDLGDEPGEGLFTARVLQLLALLTILSLAPSILIVVTSFTRIVVVLSLLRSAIGIQQTPPNPVLVTLALFLTGFVMAPTLETAYQNGIAPLIDQEITEQEAFEQVSEPFRVFMLRQVRQKDLALFLDIAGAPADTVAEDVSLRALIPAFMISELRRAFEIGFLLFIPFIVIDMVVASVLMSMGMMMLPPVIISLPFKLIFFVLMDGWYLIAGSLIESFNT